MTTIHTETLKLRGSPLEGVNPQPFFRDPSPNLPVAATEGFPADKLPGFGRETGFRILPYTKQDRYGRELTDMELQVVILENDFLRAEFIPSLVEGSGPFLTKSKTGRSSTATRCSGPPI